MSFLSLDCSQNDSRLTVFLTEGKRVFHVLILSLVRSGKGFASGRLFYGQASTYRPCPTYYATILVFLCPYVRMTVAITIPQINILQIMPLKKCQLWFHPIDVLSLDLLGQIQGYLKLDLFFGAFENFRKLVELLKIGPNSGYSYQFPNQTSARIIEILSKFPKPVCILINQSK